jgi:hypothetical protein
MLSFRNRIAHRLTDWHCLSRGAVFGYEGKLPVFRSPNQLKPDRFLERGTLKGSSVRMGLSLPGAPSSSGSFGFGIIAWGGG